MQKRKYRDYSWEQKALIRTLYKYIQAPGFYSANLIAQWANKKYPFLEFNGQKVGYTLKSLKLNIKRRKTSGIEYFLSQEVIDWHHSGRTDTETFTKFHLPHRLLKAQHKEYILHVGSLHTQTDTNVGEGSLH